MIQPLTGMFLNVLSEGNDFFTSLYHVCHRAELRLLSDGILLQLSGYRNTLDCIAGFSKMLKSMTGNLNF